MCWCLSIIDGVKKIRMPTMRLVSGCIWRMCQVTIPYIWTIVGCMWKWKRCFSGNDYGITSSCLCSIWAIKRCSRRRLVCVFTWWFSNIRDWRIMIPCIGRLLIIVYQFVEIKDDDVIWSAELRWWMMANNHVPGRRHPEWKNRDKLVYHHWLSVNTSLSYSHFSRTISFRTARTLTAPCLPILW